MYYFRIAAIALLLGWVIAWPCLAAKRKPAVDAAPPVKIDPLDRVAFAVDGAESSHGADQAMWRTDVTGPEGPMQVSEAAASDVGGGDRFDLDQNRQIGRAYLAQLYRRYGDWPDAIAAYNWGIGNLNAWVKAGRPADALLPGVAAYLGRVLQDARLCQGSPAAPAARTAPTIPRCDDLGAWSGLIENRGYSAGAGSTVFYHRLDRALRLAMEHAGLR